MEASKTEYREVVESIAGSTHTERRLTWSEMTSISYAEKSKKIRAHLLLVRWATWARRGMAKTKYPSQPTWQHLIGDTTDYEADDEFPEKIDAVIKQLPKLERRVITIFYKELYWRVKRRRSIAMFTRLVFNAESEEKISTQRVNEILDDVKGKIARNVLP